MPAPINPEKQKKWLKHLSESHKGVLLGKKHPMYGKHHSEKTRAKISESLAGRIPWNKGKTGIFSVETLEKMRNRSSWNKGMHLGPLSEEHKANIRNGLRGKNTWMKGRHLSAETKERIKNTLRGRIFSDEWKDKLSQAATGRILDVEVRMKISQSLEGKHPSVETRLKLSNSRMGPKNPNWNGGTSSLYQLIRGQAIYKLWTKSVFIRDRFQCQDCGKIGGELNAHHLYSFAQLLEDNQIISVGQAIRTEELWDIALGVTLCIKCHKKRRKKRSQILEKVEDSIDNRDQTGGY